MEGSRSRSVRMAVEAIRGQIRSGAYKAGSLLPPETTLAESLELSRGTIRRAIEALVNSGEISRKPSSRPRIEPKKTTAVAMGSEVRVWISHPIADGATLQFLKGISNGLMGTSFQLVVREPSRFFGDHVKNDERQFLSDLLSDDSAMCAIIERDSDAKNDDLYKLAIERGKYLVFVDTPPPAGMAADYVGTANAAASRRATEHLIQLGHKRIVYATESDRPYTVTQRMKGYWRAMKQAGLEESGKVFVAGSMEPETAPKMPMLGRFARGLSPSAYYNDRSMRLVREIAKMEARPTGIVVSCDVLALWLCATLEAEGFSVPGDIAVVGFDWLARWEDASMDILTTATQDFEGFGYHAAEFLLDRANDEIELEARQILLPAPLVMRYSSIGETAASGNGDSRVRVQHYR